MTGRTRGWPRATIVIAASLLTTITASGCRSQGRQSVPTSIATALVTSTTVLPATATATATVARTTPTTTAPTTTSTVPTTSTSVAATTIVTTETTASPTTARPSSARPPNAPCNESALRQALVAYDSNLSGVDVTTIACSGDYAGSVVSAPNAQPAFVVFEADTNAWKVANIGTSFVCQPLEIADPDYSAIGCRKWDQ